MNTEVHFQSDAFNTSEPRPHFINPGCFGDDVCRWMVSVLHDEGYLPVEEDPGQEDFGWYFRFWTDSAEHAFVVGWQPGSPDEPGRWIGWLERPGLLNMLLGMRSRGVSPSAVELIHRVLSSSDRFRAVTWHPHRPGT